MLIAAVLLDLNVSFGTIAPPLLLLPAIMLVLLLSNEFSKLDGDSTYGDGC